MINRLLIANRGEIACRIIRTAKRMGVHCTAIYSDEDRSALHVKEADEAYRVGPAPSTQSYLHIENIINIAKAAKIDAIHPGYGFLSENARFAEACVQNGIIFIGPPASAIRAMGSKAAAKKIMHDAKVPILPGYHGEDQSDQLLQNEAEKIGFPVLIKATAGGGGKGMRVVQQSSDFIDALHAVRREAAKSFGDDRVLIEKFLAAPRHIEIQIFADQSHQCIYLFERDCSIQRRQQKIIEEAPAPHFPESLRKQMGEAAVKAATAIGYVGAGTIEFLFDRENFYFMEMNTRLQVEHPVTEFITGVDLVEWQLRIAAGEPLPKTQEQLSIHGHAIEVRVYAEDPEHHFLPSTGKVQFLQEPVKSIHVRVDSGIQQFDSISMHYDPMIAKLIAWDKTRHAAINQLATALKHYYIAGIKTNIPYLQKIIQESDFVAGKLNTHFIENHPIALLPTEEQMIQALVVLTFVQLNQRKYSDDAQLSSSPWQTLSHWRLNMLAERQLEFRYQETIHRLHAEIHPDYCDIRFQDKRFKIAGIQSEKHWLITLDNHQIQVNIFSNQHMHLLFFDDYWLELHTVRHDQNQEIEHQGGLTAPMHGTIINVLIEVDQIVEKNQALIIMEAMKMEHTIVAPFAGKVLQVFYGAGNSVAEGAELIQLEAIET